MRLTSFLLLSFLVLLVCSKLSAQYFKPTFATGTASSDYCDGVRLMGIDNWTNSGGAPFVKDYTGLTTDLEVSFAYTLVLLNNPQNTGHISAWIDFNADQDFDEADEFLGTTSLLNPGESSSLSFVVPASAALGGSRLRVIQHQPLAQGALAPDGAFDRGEAEDYSIQFVHSAQALNITNGKDLPTMTFFQAWGPYQLAATGGQAPYTWTPVNSSDPIWNWVQLTPQGELSSAGSATGIGSFSFDVQLEDTLGATETKTFQFEVVLASVTGYCFPHNGTGPSKFQHCRSVRLGSIQNDKNGFATTGPEYFQDFTNLSTDLETGKLYTLEAQVGSVANDFHALAAWIDFNADLDFDDPGEKLGQADALAPNTQQKFNFAVPGNAQVGQTRMRIRYVFDVAPNTIDPCSSIYNIGETEDYTINILSLPQVISDSILPRGDSNTAYSHTLDANYGVLPYQWSLQEGPYWLGLDTRSGALTGNVPGGAEGQTYGFEVQLEDGNQSVTKKKMSLYINEPLGSLPFTDNFNELGSHARYDLSLGSQARIDTLADAGASATGGLQLDAQPGDSDWTITSLIADDPNQWPTNGASEHTAILAYSFDSTGISHGVRIDFDYKIVNAATSSKSWYTNFVFEWSDDGAQSWNLASGAGANVSGIYRDDTNGQFIHSQIDIPSVQTSQGTFQFRLRWLVRDAREDTESTWVALDNLKIEAISTSPPPQVTTFSLPVGQENKVYKATTGTAVQLQASGGTLPLTWGVSAGSLPQGLSLDTQTGIIQGTPVSGTVNTYFITFEVRDAQNQVDTRNLSLQITAGTGGPQPLVIQTLSLPDSTEGKAYNQTLLGAGGTAPYVWSINIISGSAAWLHLDPSTGVLSGTPGFGTGPATLVIELILDDAGNPAAQATKNLSLDIIQATQSVGLPVIDTQSLSSATESVSYAFTFQASGGQAPYSWSITAGSLPQGITLNPAGSLNGTPGLHATSTVYSFTLTLTDDLSQSVDRQLSLTVLPASSGSGSSGGASAPQQIAGGGSGGGCSMSSKDQSTFALYLFGIFLLSFFLFKKTKNFHKNIPLQ